MYRQEPTSSIHPAPEEPPFHGSHLIVRARYFYGMLLEAADMQDEQDFHLGNTRRHSMDLHGAGTVRGLRVDETCQQETVKIEPGVALDWQGREIRVEDAVTVDLHDAVSEAVKRQRQAPCAGAVIVERGQRSQQHDHAVEVYVSLRYAEAPERPVQAIGGPEPACASICEASRVRHGFEVIASADPPRAPDLSELLDPLFRKALSHDELRRWLADLIVDDGVALSAGDRSLVGLAAVKVVPDGGVVHVDNAAIRPLVLPTSLLTELIQYLATNPGRSR